MQSPELSPAPTGRGLKSMLAKARGNRPDNSSSISVANTENSNESRGVKDTMDNALDKLKTLARRDNDGDSPTTNGAISKKLISDPIKRIKQKRKARKATALADGAEPRNNSTGSESLSTPETGSRNQSIFGDEDDDDRSSMMTGDSDEDSSVIVTAPPLISHPSHAGYLTSSSPSIKATTLPTTPDLLSTVPPLTPSISRATTLPPLSNTISTDTNLATVNGSTLEPITTTSTLSVDSMGSGRSSKSRSISPGFRIKEALKSGSRRNSEKNGSPERPLFSPVGSGLPLGGLFNKDKRGSISSRRASKAADEPPHLPQAIQIQNGAATSSNRSLPTLVTPVTPPSNPPQTPLTTITPPTPVDRDRDDTDRPQTAMSNKPDISQSPKNSFSNGTNSIGHRRVRSDSATHQPSKLSNSMTAPLTPMIEETSRPASRTASGNSTGTPGGFFSSVFVAAQNAANTLSNTIGNNNNNASRSRSGTGATEDNEKGTSEITPVTTNQSETASISSTKPLAVDTIGTGDLSLSHLGFSSDTLSTATTATSPALGKDGQGDRGITGQPVHQHEAAARAEDASAARAVSAAYEAKSGDDAGSTPTAEDSVPAVKSRSIYESSLGDKTPPNGSIFEGDGGHIWRSGSLRSKVDRATKRHRNSSAATSGTTIGAAIASSHNMLASPVATSTVPKSTGFAVASKKRNRDFHSLFRSIPEDDYLIEDYSCALQRDIILAGRIYVSEGHICFSSNILGWVTTLIISFDEVVSVEKETTAMVFPNAIAIQTLHARHTFRSLLSREATYDLLIGIWRVNHPSLQSSENGVKIVNGGTGSKTEKLDPIESEEGSEGSEEDEEVYDEDEEDDDEEAGSIMETLNDSLASNEPPEPQQVKAVMRKASALGIVAGQAGSVPISGEAKAAEKVLTVAAAATDFPGPATHVPTECADSATHYEKVLKDEVIPAPLGKIYNMLFGNASGGFVSRFLLDEMKVFDLQFDDDKKGLSEENRTRSYSYIKPLGGSIGPKQTKCLTTENLDAIDLERAVSVTVTTQTPDVPSGNVFSTKTRYCLMWGPNNGTRLIMCCMIEWTGKSWLKNPIEKGANDGQTVYANELVKVLRAGTSARPRAGTSTSKLKKGRKRKADVDGFKPATSRTNALQKTSTNWGPLEPLHSLLAPIIDILDPLLTANSLIGLLLFLLIISWFRNSRLRAHTPALGPYPQGLSTPQKIAAYEEIWRQEEEALWDWLEERVGMSPDFAFPHAEHSNGDRSRRAMDARKAVLKGGKGEVGDVKGMGRREVEWAIGVTEEKLRVLKGIVQGDGTEMPEVEMRKCESRNVRGDTQPEPL